MRRLIFVVAILVAGCAGAVVTTPPATTAPPSPSQPLAAASPTLVAIEGWPTVAQARDRLAAAGYELVNDIAATGQNRWTGPDPNLAPVEILGDEDAPASLAISVDPLDATGSAKHLDAVLAFLPPDDRLIVLDLVTDALTAVLDGEEDSPQREAVLSGGRAEVSLFGTDEMFVFLRPFGVIPAP